MKKSSPQKMLFASFLLMIVIGLGNKIFQKLQTIPMYIKIYLYYMLTKRRHNYPFFLNLMSTFIYIPASFLYIIPMIKYGNAITDECLDIPKWKFAVMGSLDGIGGVMSVFAVNFITNSSMIILLTQASIPISMAMSKFLLDAKYTRFQCCGAFVVLVGIAVVLMPSFAGPSSGDDGHNQLLWALVLVISCVPNVLSSVYKEKALGETDVDVIYMNGWIAIYQFLICLPLAVPSAWASNLTLAELPKNVVDGAKCYVGINSIVTESDVDDCSSSFVFVTIYLLFNLFYNILLIMILKYGSANILWLAMTIMVPLGNVAFSLDFVPGHQPLKSTDIAGLVVIMCGLVFYRFADKCRKSKKYSFDQDEDHKAANHGARYIGFNGIEVMLEPLIDNYRQKMYDCLKKSPLQIRSSYLSRLGFTPSPPGPMSASRRSAIEKSPLLKYPPKTPVDAKFLVPKDSKKPKTTKM